MNLLDIFESREPHQQAIDRLEQRRIEDLEAKMDDFARRGMKDEFLKCKEERDSYYAVKEGNVITTPTGLKHQAKPGTYGGYEPEADPLARLDKHAVNRAEKAMGVKFDREKKYQGGLDLDEKLGDNRPKLGSARDIGKSVKKFRANRGLDEGSMKDWLWGLAERMDRDVFVGNADDYGMTSAEAAEFWDSINGVDEAGIGQDIVSKQEKMARATPQTKAGAVASTVKNAAKWLAGKGGPGKEGPTYEDQAQKKKLDLHKGVVPTEPLPEHGGGIPGGKGWQSMKPTKRSWQSMNEKDTHDRDVQGTQLIRKARSLYPVAGSDEEALALYVADIERQDVAQLKAKDQAQLQTLKKLNSINTDQDREIDDIEADISNLTQQLTAKLSKAAPKTVAPVAAPAQAEPKPTATATEPPSIVVPPEPVKTVKSKKTSPVKKSNTTKLNYRPAKKTYSKAEYDAMNAQNSLPGKKWTALGGPGPTTIMPKQLKRILPTDDMTIDMQEGFQDFNKVEPYAVCLAGKPVKKFDYYEEARRFHDNWKQKLYREGNKEKADKITLMPLGLDEVKADPTGSWVVYNGSKIKRFKTHSGATTYAEKMGGKVASSEFYADKVQGVKEGIVASGPSKPLDDRAVRKMVWDTMKINADTGEQALQRALAVLDKKPQSRMVQDLQDKFQNLADRLAQGLVETVVDVRTEMARVYNKLAPKIERYRDSFLAGQLYDELENIAELHGAEDEFKRMMNGARNRAHMEYDTNPGGFQNWFWFLPFGDEQLDEFAPGPERDNDEVPNQLLKLANRWWNATDDQPKIANVLRSLGWSIAQVESEDDAVQLMHNDGTTYFISADDFDPDVFEAKTRLDPKCWTGKKIGNPKTKMKGGVRVNNCVPAEESYMESVKKQGITDSKLLEAAAKIDLIAKAFK